MPAGNKKLPREEALAHPQLTCCGMMLCIWRPLAVALKLPAAEMLNESGHGNAPVNSKPVLIESIYLRSNAFLLAKHSLVKNKAITFEEEDLASLQSAEKLIKKLRDEVLVPISGLAKSKKSNNVEKIRMAGDAAWEITEQAKTHYLRAKRRFDNHFKTSEESTITEDDYAVVSIDMSAYSVFALSVQSNINARALFELNQKIENNFRKCLQYVNVNPKTTPIESTGDGALIFFKKAEKAVEFALKVQSDFRNLENKEDGGEISERGFRIGIASGSVCVQKQMTGKEISNIRVAGVPIIDAVRIENACTPTSIIISELVYNALSADERLKFHKRPPICAKESENREIEVYQYVRP